MEYLPILIFAIVVSGGLVRSKVENLVVRAVPHLTRPPNQMILERENQGTHQALEEAEKHLKSHKQYILNYHLAASHGSTIGNAVAHQQAHAVRKTKLAYQESFGLALTRMHRINQETRGQVLSPIDRQRVQSAVTKSNNAQRKARQSLANYRAVTVHARNKSQHLTLVAVHDAAAGEARKNGESEKLAYHERIVKAGLTAASAIDRGPSLLRKVTRNPTSSRI